MRFKLTLQIDKKYGNILAFNYQYELHAMVYKILARSNEQFAAWLHNNGFKVEKKQFKLFSFSRLQIPKFKLRKEGLEILSNSIYWNIAFLPQQSTREFILGVFKEQEFDLCTEGCKIHLRIQNIEAIAEPTWQPIMQFKTLSPICIVQRNEAKKNLYIAPDNPNAENLLRQNLLNKYQALTGEKYPQKNFPFKLKTLSRPKPVLITIKAGKAEESQIRGFMGDFEMQAPPQIMNIAYNGGLGSKNSTGFGMIEIKPNNKSL